MQRVYEQSEERRKRKIVLDFRAIRKHTRRIHFIGESLWSNSDRHDERSPLLVIQRTCFFPFLIVVNFRSAFFFFSWNELVSYLTSYFSIIDLSPRCNLELGQIGATSKLMGALHIEQTSHDRRCFDAETSADFQSHRKLSKIKLIIVDAAESWIRSKRFA